MVAGRYVDILTYQLLAEERVMSDLNIHYSTFVRLLIVFQKGYRIIYREKVRSLV